MWASLTLVLYSERKSLKSKLFIIFKVSYYFFFTCDYQNALMWMTLISREMLPHPHQSSLPSSISCDCPRHTLISSLHQLPLPSLRRSPLIASLPDVFGISALAEELTGRTGEWERFLPTALPRSLQRDSCKDHWPREQTWDRVSEFGTPGPLLVHPVTWNTL